MISYLARLYERAFRHDDWNVGVVYAPISSLVEAKGEIQIHWFPRPAKGKFFADPFGVKRDEAVYILCEEFDYRRPKGRIVSIRFKDGVFGEPTLALELPCHVSYPYLIEHEGQIYCVPETYAALEIGLYRAIEFPNRWEKAGVLVDEFAGVDSTVFQFEGRWWLTSTSEDESLQDLYAWHSQDLLGPWIPHARNPMKRDIRSARPAGTPFLHRGSLYRPAQDCSKTYGGRVVLNRVLRLNPSEFAEEPASFVEPDMSGPWRDGTHTISSVGSITLIDGKRLRFIPNALKNDLLAHISGIARRGTKTILGD